MQSSSLGPARPHWGVLRDRNVFLGWWHWHSGGGELVGWFLHSSPAAASRMLLTELFTGLSMSQGPWGKLGRGQRPFSELQGSGPLEMGRQEEDGVRAVSCVPGSRDFRPNLYHLVH